MATKRDYYVPDEPAKFYLDDVLLPVTPHTLSISQNSKNESESLFDGRPFTRTRLMDAQNMTIEWLLPFYEETTICFPDTWHERKWFTDWFWKKNENREYYVISIIYPNGEFYNGIWMMDKWDYKQTGGKGSDWEFSLSFTEGYPRENIETFYPLENPNVMVGARNYRRVS